MFIDRLRPHYAMRENRNGYWTVYDVSTGAPVIIDDIVFDSLRLKEAELLLELLNEEGLACTKETMH